MNMGIRAENTAELLQSGLRYAISLTHDTHRAEDVLQDAWLAVLKARGPHSKPYLFRVIRTRFINYNKREQLVLWTSKQCPLISANLL